MECLERPYEVKKVHFVKQNIGAERHRIGSEYFVTGASKKDEAIEEREEKVVVDEGDSPSSYEVSEKRGLSVHTGKIQFYTNSVKLPPYILLLPVRALEVKNVRVLTEKDLFVTLWIKVMWKSPVCPLN